MTGYVGPIQGVVHGIYDGPHATPPEADSGPVFLGIKNVTPGGRLDLSEIRHVSEEHYPKWTRRVTPQSERYRLFLRGHPASVRRDSGRIPRLSSAGAWPCFGRIPKR